MTLVWFALPAGIAAIMTFALVPPVRMLALRIGAIDMPGPRKIHSEPRARLGGLAVVAAVFVVFSAIAFSGSAALHALSPKLLAGVAGGLIPIFVVSFIDDIRPVRARRKLLAHGCGAALVIAMGNALPPTIALFGHSIRLGLLSMPLSLIWIVAITNAFNIIDGLDGLSAGLALISSISLTAFAFVVGDYRTAGASLVLAGALIGFLPYNMYPAKIFLGDTGATAIGFVLACLTLERSITSAGLAVVLPLMIVGIPLADTAISVVRRIVARIEGNSKGVFDADRRHIHHRLLALGLNQWRAALTLYTAGIVFAGAALLSLFMEQRKAALLLIGVVAAAFVGIFKLGYDELAVWRRGSLLRIYDAPVLRIGLFIAFIDLALVIVSLYAALVLKYDDWSLTKQRLLAVQLLCLLPALTITVFAAMRVYKRSWRNASFQDILMLSGSAMSAGFLGYIICSIVLNTAVTATFFVLYTMCLFALVASSRVSYRLLCHWKQNGQRSGEPVLIYGAGRAGSLALREIQTNDLVPMIPVGFIDDDPTKRGRWIHGFPVLGSVNALEHIVLSRGIRGVVVSSEKIEISRLRDAQQQLKDDLWIRRFRISFQDEFLEPGRSAFVRNPKTVTVEH